MDLANIALASNDGSQVPPAGADRTIHCRFRLHEARLIIEIDGSQHDRSSLQEAERSQFLQNEGYRILRFWNNEILSNLDRVYDRIADELGRITPTQPSLIKGEGFRKHRAQKPEHF